jgi:hypothetical protein
MARTNGKIGPGSVEIDGERYATDTFVYDGTTYTMRELSVDEGDDIWDAAQKPDKTVDNRLNSRLLLAKSLVEPVVSVEQVGKWGGRKYVTLMRHFDGLNTVPVENPTPPAGSAGPTSPAGGEPLPTP